MPIPDGQSGPAPGDTIPARNDATPRGGMGEGTHWLPESTSVVALVRERGGGLSWTD